MCSALVLKRPGSHFTWTTIAFMARLKIRHLPVLQDGDLAGIISIRDLTNWAVRELTSGHELPDLERSHTALSAAAEVNRAPQ